MMSWLDFIPPVLLVFAMGIVNWATIDFGRRKYEPSMGGLLIVLAYGIACAYLGIVLFLWAGALPPYTPTPSP